MTVAPGRVVVVTVGAGLTTRVKACSANAPLASVTRTVKLELPATVGVPLSTPVGPSNEIPAGRVPRETDQESGTVPPVTAKVSLYEAVRVASGSEVVATTGAGLVTRTRAWSSWIP